MQHDLKICWNDWSDFKILIFNKLQKTVGILLFFLHEYIYVHLYFPNAKNRPFLKYGLIFNKITNDGRGESGDQQCQKDLHR